MTAQNEYAKNKMHLYKVEIHKKYLIWDEQYTLHKMLYKLYM